MYITFFRSSSPLLSAGASLVDFIVSMFCRLSNIDRLSSILNYLKFDFIPRDDTDKVCVVNCHSIARNFRFKMLLANEAHVEMWAQIYKSAPNIKDIVLLIRKFRSFHFQISMTVLDMRHADMVRCFKLNVT